MKLSLKQVPTWLDAHGVGSRSMAWERPAWTAIFFLIYVMLFVASVIMHVAVGRTTPAVESLVDNLAKGLYQAFGFDSMVAESTKIMKQSVQALNECEPLVGKPLFNGDAIGLFRVCPSKGLRICDTTLTSYKYSTKKPDTTEHVSAISKSFAMSMEKIIEVGQDPYLGNPSFKTAAYQCKQMQDFIKDVRSTESCCAQIPVYCSLHAAGKGLNTMAGSIAKDIISMSNNPGVEAFKEVASYLDFFHALPYIMFVSLLLYTVLWYKNGAMCCCTNGSMLQCCCIILPQMVFWLLGYSLAMVFTVLGYAISIVFATTQLEDFPGSPTVQDLLDHVEKTYPDFWQLAFSALLVGLKLFRDATTFFVVIAHIMLFHACCFCICRPYDVVGDQVADLSVVPAQP